MALAIGVAMAEALLQEAERDFEALELVAARIDQHRCAHRTEGYLCILRSDDYLYVRSCLSFDDMPPPPDPSNVMLSKRTWERHMENWRHALKVLRRQLER